MRAGPPRHSLTRDGQAFTLKTMEVHFKPEVEAKIQRVAAGNRSTADDYVQRVVEQHFDHDSWFRQRVKKGLDQLDRGEFLTHEEVGQRLEKMFSS